MTTTGSLLPIDGPAGRVLAAVIDAMYPLRTSEISKASNLSRYAVMRALPALEEAGLVHTAFDRAYAFNESHLLAEVAMRQLWHLYGCRAPARRRDLGDSQNLFHRYEGLVPDWVMEDHESPAVRVPQGPSLVTARSTVDRINGLVPQLTGLESIGQSVYYSWHDERLRDFIHSVLHLGTTTSAAAAVLERHASMTAQGDSSPIEVAVHPDQWGRAIYLINGDARWLEILTRTFEESASLGAQVTATREAALSTLARSARRSLFPEQHKDLGTGVEDEVAARYTAFAEERDRVDQVTALKQLTAAQAAYRDARGRLHHVGGMPTINEFGRNGDMILAVVLRQKLKGVLSLVEDMQAEPCWERWHQAQSDRPQLAAIADEPSNARSQDLSISVEAVTAEDVGDMYFTSTGSRSRARPGQASRA